MATIEVKLPDRQPVRYPLRWGDISVGRNVDCDMCIPLPAVSGRHMSLQLQIRLRDHGSTNGTHVSGEAVREYVLDDDTPVHIGKDGDIQLQILFDHDRTTLSGEPTLIAGTGHAAEIDGSHAAHRGNANGNTRSIDDNEVEQLRARVAELEAALAAEPEPTPQLVKNPATVSGEEAGQTHLFSRLGELQEKLHREQNARSAAESKLKVLSHSGFSGAQEALQLVQKQRQQIEDLETALEIAQRRADRGSERGTTKRDHAPNERDALLAHLRQEMGFDAAMGERLLVQENFPSDCGFLLGRLYGFSRDVERVVTRLAQRYRGGVASADQTIMPGAVGNLSQGVHGLLLRGSEHHRNQLQETLNNLRVWCGICLTAYEQGAKQWSRELLQRITPQQIQQRAGQSFVKRALGLEGWECWKLYREVMRDVTPDIAQDQIDDIASRAASEMAEREGAW